MPRRKSEPQPEMPGTIARSDQHAQEIWKKTHDSAVKTYGEGRRAHMVAFASLNQSSPEARAKAKEARRAYDRSRNKAMRKSRG